MSRYPGIVDTVGRTPLVHLARTSNELGVEIHAKLEAANPAGSVKDRIARAMVRDAEESGKLAPGATLIEPTSGNTGIALAMIAAARGYHLIITMPETMSAERVQLLRAYGAEVVLTRGSMMKHAIEQAELLRASTPGAVLLGQFDNPANPRTHRETTAEEILDDMDGGVDVFVAGIGTGGTISGVGGRLKETRADTRVVGVEPASSAVLSGGAPHPHRIQGIGAGFVPAVLDRSVVDEVVAVSDDEALDAARSVARREGILAGFSSGAALAAAGRLAKRPELSGKRFVVVFPDSAERYASTPLFEALAT
jgi:cysteine synthase A